MAWAGRVAMVKGHQGCCLWAGRWLVECPRSSFCREKVLGFGPRVLGWGGGRVAHKVFPYDVGRH